MPLQNMRGNIISYISVVLLIIPFLASDACYSSGLLEHKEEQSLIELRTLRGPAESLTPEVVQDLESLTENSLLIVDLDSTLVKEPLFSNKILRDLSFELARSRGWFGKFYMLRVLWAYYKERTLELVEPEWILVLQQASANGVTIIAETRHTISVIPTSMAVQHRMKELEDIKLFGYFNPMFNNSLTFLKSSKQSPPVFYKGILMTVEDDKGTALEGLIQMLRQLGNLPADWPDNILAFDDKRKEELEFIMAAARRMKIRAKGYHYVACENMQPKSPEPYQVLQAYILGTRGRWLTVENASTWLLAQPIDTQNSFIFSTDLSELKRRKAFWDTATNSLFLKEGWVSSLIREIRFSFDLAKLVFAKITEYFYNFKREGLYTPSPVIEHPV